MTHIASNDFYDVIKAIIDQAKNNAIVQVNQWLVLMYRKIWKFVKEDVLWNEKAEYGNRTIRTLWEKLTLEYGTWFGYRNLFRMIKLHECFDDKEIVTTLSSKCSWSHFLELIKIDDESKREFYMSFCMHENRSVRVLKNRIDSQLFERTVIAKEPANIIKNDLQQITMQTAITNEKLFLRDPYLLDFLELDANFNEKDLENAILQDLEKFMLEFGSDFAFLARQKRISIGDRDYFVDLLFYHRKLKRLIVIELKLWEFSPEQKWQVELYLNYFKKYEKQEWENDPIAIILCSWKDEEVVELMDLGKSDIHVSEYWLQLPPKEILQQKLHKALKKKEYVDVHTKQDKAEDINLITDNLALSFLIQEPDQYEDLI